MSDPDKDFSISRAAKERISDLMALGISPEKLYMTVWAELTLLGTLGLTILKEEAMVESYREGIRIWEATPEIQAAREFISLVKKTMTGASEKDLLELIESLHPTDFEETIN